MAGYTWGVILPTSATDDRDHKPLALLPADIRRVTVGLGLSDYRAADVEDAMGRYWGCVDDLVAGGAQSVVLAGVPISAQLGRARVLGLLEETTERTSLGADAALEAMVGALQRLGLGSVTIGSRWTDELNGLMVGYLTAAGIEVLYVNSAKQWGREAFGMSIEDGTRLALALGTDALQQAPDAEALILPGGTWRALGVVPYLEETFAKTVITNDNARTWRLIHNGHAPPVPGWGRLLAAG